MNKDKFTYKKGDLKVELSQCGPCENNEDTNKCKVHGEKPDRYKYNETHCPDLKP